MEVVRIGWLAAIPRRQESGAKAGKEVPMRTFLHSHHPDSHYFEGHPLQGTFALTFASIVLVGLIALAIVMVS